MGRLVAVKCPACGASTRVDEAAEYHSCQQCKTTAFVRSQSRAVPPEVLQQHIPIIVLPGYTWTLFVAMTLAVVGVVAVGVLLFRNMDTRAWTSDDFATAIVSDNTEPALSFPNVDMPQPVSAESPGVPVPAPVAVSVAVPIPRPTDSNAPAGSKDNEVGPKPTSVSKQQIVEPPAPSPKKSGAGKVSTGQLTVSGRLDHGTIRKVVGGANARFRMCYERGLQKVPTLTGGVTVRFVIGRDGAVSNVSSNSADMPDPDVKQCVVRAFYGLRFPSPESGIVTVVYPLKFRPA